MISAIDKIKELKEEIKKFEKLEEAEMEMKQKEKEYLISKDKYEKLFSKTFKTAPIPAQKVNKNE